jgi:hypothetical protein
VGAGEPVVEDSEVLEVLGRCLVVEFLDLGDLSPALAEVGGHPEAVLFGEVLAFEVGLREGEVCGFGSDDGGDASLGFTLPFAVEVDGSFVGCFAFLGEVFVVSVHESD